MAYAIRIRNSKMEIPWFCMMLAISVMRMRLLPFPGKDGDALAKALHLRPEQKIMLSQTVGYPARMPAARKGVN